MNTEDNDYVVYKIYEYFKGAIGHTFTANNNVNIVERELVNNKKELV